MAPRMKVLDKIIHATMFVGRQYRWLELRYVYVSMFRLRNFEL